MHDISDMKEYRDILVFCEQRDGVLLRTSFELVSEARKLADELGCQVHCLLIGNDFQSDVRMPGGYGADKVLICQNDKAGEYNTDIYTEIVCRVAVERKPEILLFAATKVGRDLAPRCAARLGTGLTADCTRLDVDVDRYREYLKENTNVNVEKENFNPEDKNLKMTRPAFGGHLMATIICPRFRPCMSTVRPGVFSCRDFDRTAREECQVEFIQVEITDRELRVTIEEVVKHAKKKVDFSDADIIVSVGRGIEKKVEEGLALAEQLADALGGAPIGCSRAVADQGWLPEDHQIGQTGKTVHPQLYIALGISGAVQHEVGIRDSEFILAVNKNADAPIFSIADYGICGDLFQVVPLLIDEIRKVKEQ